MQTTRHKSGSNALDENGKAAAPMWRRTAMALVAVGLFGGCDMPEAATNASGAKSAASGDQVLEIADICTSDARSFAQRGAALEALGYAPIRTSSKMWVQAQVAHIALSNLASDPKLSATEIKSTYDRFKASADAGNLFLANSQVAEFRNAAGTVEISLSDISNERACSIAFAKGTAVWNPRKAAGKTVTRDFGSYQSYALSPKIEVLRSTLAPLWDEWMKDGRRTSGFFIIGLP